MKFWLKTYISFWTWNFSKNSRGKTSQKLVRIWQPNPYITLSASLNRHSWLEEKWRDDHQKKNQEKTPSNLLKKIYAWCLNTQVKFFQKLKKNSNSYAFYVQWDFVQNSEWYLVPLHLCRLKLQDVIKLVRWCWSVLSLSIADAITEKFEQFKCLLEMRDTLYENLDSKVNGLFIWENHYVNEYKKSLKARILFIILKSSVPIEPQTQIPYCKHV